MTWPEWAGPFGIPENYDEVQDFILTSGAAYLIGTAGYEIAVRHNIPRMASHSYANPSLRAIRAASARGVIFPSLSNAASLASHYLSPAVKTTVRRSPVLVAPAIGVAMASDVAESSFNAAAYTSGADVSAGSVKPWWLPVIFWV